MRFGPGPVFVYEWLRLSRKWQVYALRSVFVGLLLGALCFTWGPGDRGRGGEGLRASDLAWLGQVIYGTIAIVELTLILLAAPAATAGSVCLDKARGTLVHVMATDLTDSEIVLGKLGSALLPVFGLVFCVLPVMMLASLLGGIDPTLLLGSSLVTLATALLVCSLAFLLSVLGRKTHEVLGATYLALIGWLALMPLFTTMLYALVGPRALAWGFDPIRVILAVNPYGLIFPNFNESAADLLARVLYYAGGCLALSLAMVFASIRLIRRVTLNQRPEARPRARASRRRPRLLPAPSLDANPVLWREWTRSTPSRWGRFVEFCHLLFALILASMTVADQLDRGPRMHDPGVAANLYVVCVGLLLLSVRASTSLFEERVRGSLDVLLTTPLSTPEILAGKWWGTFRRVLPMLILPALIGILNCSGSGAWPAFFLFLLLIAGYGAVVTSVGLAVSVWVSRQGRAVGICVGLYAAACVGWPILTVLTSQGPHSPAGVMLLGSPVAGTLLSTLAQSESPGQAGEGWVLSLIFWNALQAAFAFGVFCLACRTFDDQLGRASSRDEEGWLLDLIGTMIPRFRQPAGE